MNFKIFILSYGRPNNIKTLNALKKANNTNEVIIITSLDDKTILQYRENYNNVITFDKQDYIGNDGDNNNNYKTVLYARRFIYDYCKENDIDYFLMLDDDYSGFYIKGIKTKKNIPVDNFDFICEKFLNYMQKTNIYLLCFCQAGDFIGGFENDIFLSLGRRRKAMNCFFCKTDRKITFLSKLNDDVTTYTNYGNRGYLMLSIPYISVVQAETQKQNGGLTEIYLEMGTYVKSFTSVMFNPSCVKISSMGRTDRRIHHKIKWVNTVPMIIRKELKK